MIKNSVFTSFISLLFFTLTPLQFAYSAQANFSQNSEASASQVTSFKGIPWGMSFLNESDLLISMKQGELWLWNSINGEKYQILGLPSISAYGQGGLLDVAVYPQKYQVETSTNTDAGNRFYQWIYFTYIVSEQGKATTALARAQLILPSSSELAAKKVSTLELINWQRLLVTKAFSSKGQHFGSRIAFDNSGHLFFGVGDRGERSNAQDLTNHAGAILRLNLDGSVPADNPFVSNKQALAEIWSYGHRNPQGIFFDSTTNALLVAEHGPRGGDEINLIKKGANYGWPIVSFGKEYWGPVNVGEATSKEGMQDPLHVYIPSIAPSFLVKGLDSHFYLGALAKRHLNSVTGLTDEQQISESRLLLTLGERLRSMAIRSDGQAFIGADSGKIYTLELKTK